MSNPRLIGIHGRARSGKDTVANFLVENHFYLRYAFADPLRGFVSRITGIPVEDLIDGPTKEEIYEPLGKSPRYMMQTLGTEWGRNLINSEIWVQAMIVKYEEAQRNCVCMVVPDVRFENEASIIRKLGGQLWHITRPGTLTVNEHVSEAGVEPQPDDYLIHNGGSINDLYDVIDDLIFPLA